MSTLPRPRGKSVEGYIRWALGIADLIVEEYLARSLKPATFPRSVDDLFQIIRELYRTQYRADIEVYYLPSNEAYRDERTFLALMERRRDQSVRIFLNPQVERTAQRLGLLKEGVQVLLNSAHARSIDLSKSIKNYLGYRKFRMLDVATEVTIAELVAEIAAMEILFPHKDRIGLLQMRSSDRRRTANNVAAKYGIPVKWVRFYLSDTVMTQLRPFRRTTSPGNAATPKKNQSKPTKNR